VSDVERGEQRLFGDRLLRRMNLIWAAFFYGSLGLSLAATIAGAPGGLGGWQLAALLGLGAASAALFQLIYWRQTSEPDCWPMPLRPALIYFGGQLLILAALLAGGGNFIGLGFALMGQGMGALRPRHWALVLVPLLALLGLPLGLYELGAGTNWLGLATFGLMLAIWMFIATLLALLFGQRAQLLDLVGELRAARSQLEAAAAQQEELAVLRERARLAREMHDSLGHALVSVNVKLEAAQRLYQVDAARGDAELEATRALVREAMGGLRRSLADMRGPLPGADDLAGALRQLAAEAQARSGLGVRVVDELRATRPPPATATALLLIAREALMNVERHAGARSAELRVGCAEGAWLLAVCDDGRGIRPEELRRPGHYGVVGMRERAAALGGALRVAPRPGGGTEVVATIPEQGAPR
jgi:signal transduction histidine kinase